MHIADLTSSFLLLFLFLFYSSLTINFAHSIPTITAPDTAGPPPPPSPPTAPGDKYPGCICPWGKGDEGCHIIGYKNFTGVPSSWSQDQDMAFCAAIDTKKNPPVVKNNVDYYECPGGIEHPNCNVCWQSIADDVGTYCCPPDIDPDCSQDPDP